MKPKYIRFIALAFLAALPTALSMGCSGGDPGTRYPNQAPVIRITGGPIDESRDSYTARVFWSAYDNDGIITHYEYAIDPPLGIMNEDEITHPEDTTSVTIEVIPGPTEFADTLRVCKVVDGEIYCFDWVQTTDFSRAFAFETPDPDSVFTGVLEPAPFFTGVHTVYVRARDNEGMYSRELARIAYTAETITPTARIDSPNITSAEILNVGPTLTIRMSGIDPDSPEPNKRPTSYLYRLLRLDTLEPPLSLLGLTSPKILFTHGGPIVWNPVDADTESVTLLLATPGSYVFGMRAVDLVGAEEPFLEFGRNAFKFQALPQAGFPQLKITEAALGPFPNATGAFYRGSSRVEETEVPVGQRLRFTWQANADDYGGTIEAFSWGIDIPDLDREGPNSGWSGWGPITGNFETLVFPSAGIHVLYVRARDVAGAITLGTLLMKVVDFPLDRDILWVDDTLDDIVPTDSQSSAFWLDRLNAYNDREEAMGNPRLLIDVFKAHGENQSSNVPRVPELVDLGRYRILVWDNYGNGFNGRSTLLAATVTKPILAPYLAAGGKMWLSGRINTAATMSTNGITADFGYPKNLTTRPNNFMFKYMKVHSSSIDRPSEDNKDSFLSAIPAPEEIYPRMDIDPLKLNPIQALLGGILNCEAVFDPIFAESEPGFRGDVDTLYYYGAAGNLLNPDRIRNSRFNNKLCGIRWKDPDADRTHGRTQWFAFSMYYIKNEEAQETLNRSLDWFREEVVGQETP